MRTVTALADMTGRTCVITGGLGHLGIAMAEALAENGASVVLIDRSEVPAVPERFAALEASAPDRIHRRACDLSEPVALDALIAELVASFPVIDVLINNAAFVGTAASQGWATAFETQSPDLWRQAVEINLTVPFVLVRGLLPAMRAAAAPAILNIGSIYGLVGPDWRIYEGSTLGNPAAYAASKGGLMQFTRYLATTLAPKIRVNAICPGGIERGHGGAFLDAYVARTPLGRMATLEDFKGAAIYFASDLSAYVTGQILAVDGGWTTW
ncbi:MAG: SDR family oxidoreductase [Siculibacillus sp.]|nr:SDR family oxidoreductase [Siculibacillus sp.]